jgi:P pilus assembly chaperone PapD
MMTGRALVTVLALFGVPGLPVGARAQLSVAELEVFLQPEAAASRTGVIRITNEADQPVQALLEVQDWRRDETGANQFRPLGSVAGSCGGQIEVFPAAVRIDAHATEAVRVSFTGTAATSCWAIVFIQANEPPRQPGRQSQVTYVIRTGVKVYVQPERAVRSGEVSAVRLVTVQQSAADSSSVRSVEVLFLNTGEAHLRTAGAIEVRNADNQVAAKLSIASFPIAPHDTRRLLLPLPQLPPGRYIVLALLDYGGAEIAAGQAELEIPR